MQNVYKILSEILPKYATIDYDEYSLWFGYKSNENLLYFGMIEIDNAEYIVYMACCNTSHIIDRIPLNYSHLGFFDSFKKSYNKFIREYIDSSKDDELKSTLEKCISPITLKELTESIGCIFSNPVDIEWFNDFSQIYSKVSPTIYVEQYDDSFVIKGLDKISMTINNTDDIDVVVEDFENLYVHLCMKLA